MITSTELAGAVRDHRLSTVVPGRVTVKNTVHELAGGDLAMKLHYLRAVYYFVPTDTVRKLTVPLLKEPMFCLLDIYNAAAGRIRWDEAGRPHIRCNDGGVRIIEATCDLSMEEWLRRKQVDGHRQLVPEKVVGPDIQFSPTVLIQFTRFRCGGMAVGLSWAHLLGDPVSASNFMNQWGQLLSGKVTSKNVRSRRLHKEPEKSAKLDTALPLSVKQAEQVGDFWLTPNTRRMAAFSIVLTASKLNDLRSKVPANTSVFETLSALIWRSIAKIRVENEPKTITVCRNSSAERREVFCNRVEIKAVTASSSPSESELPELAGMINKEAVDEMKTIGELGSASEKLDLILYGSNLTFVDMESINFYGLELKGQKPVHVDYSIHGVGNEGAVLVLQGPDANNAEHAGSKGRLISFILPEGEIPQLRELLENDWGIAQ